MATVSTTDVVRQIAGLARSGKLDEAALLAAQAWNAHSDDPVLAALAGAVENHRGQFERAVPYLNAALRINALDMTVRSNLVEALYRIGRRDEALQLCDDTSARADSSLRLARLGANLAQEVEQYDRAISLYRHVLVHDGTDWSSWNNLGNALTSVGRPDEAVDALRRAASLEPLGRPIRVNLGNALIGAERFEEAEQVLRDAARDFPDDAKPLLILADFYRRSGREEDAFAALGEAARRAPGDTDILIAFGQDASRHNEYATAEAAYEAALALTPDLGPPFVGLAAIYERSNRESELDALRDRAVAAGIDGASIAYIDTLRLKRVDRFAEALAALDEAQKAVLDHRRHQLRGILLDRLGRYDEAFAEFAQMNALQLDEPSQPGERAKLYCEHIAQSDQLLTSAWVDQWTAGASTDHPAPVFLLGFPRSGTTLLDTMLMAASNTLILEEEPFIAELEYELGGIEALPALDAAAIDKARVDYFDRVSRLGALGPETLIVDKHPLHGNKIPAIRRLFPEARFIFAQRHPCDVLLSCFITNFRTNHAMSNFLELETAAELYDLTMSYWTKAREIFDLPVMTVVYERLVEDTSRELRPLFDWLELSWPGGEFDHREAARARGVVRTASYAQVTEPVYKRAAGRWQRYRKHLEPVFDRIAPWVERFGYSLDDDRIPAWPDQQNVSVR